MIPLGVLASRRPASGGGPIEATYLTSVGSSTSLNAYTFTSVPLGAASAHRTIVVAIASRGHTSISSVTIAGSTATVAADVNGFTGGAGNNRAAVCYATVPTGTDGDVTVTYAGGTGARNCFLWFWHIAGPVYVRDYAATMDNPAVLDSDVAAGDFVVAVVRGNSFGDNVHTWTGVTRESAASNVYETAAHSVDSTELPRTIRLASSNTLSHSAAVAVFRGA